MKTEHRQEQIVRRLRALQAELSVEELTELFQVSALTVRRDLDHLERAGVILRTHGGAVLRTTVGSVYHQKVALNFDLKQAIGQAASAEVKDGNMILINDGSTPFHLASQLSGKRDLIVYTNSMAVVSELSRFPAIRLYILGGEYNSALHYLGGSMMEQMLESLLFDAVFLGTDAVDRKGNCLVADPQVAHLTRVMLRRGRRRFLLADHTKVGAGGHAVYGKLSDLDAWYTTASIDPALLREFRKMTTVHVVSPAPTETGK